MSPTSISFTEIPYPSKLWDNAERRHEPRGGKAFDTLADSKGVLSAAAYGRTAHGVFVPTYQTANAYDEHDECSAFRAVSACLLCGVRGALYHNILRHRKDILPNSQQIVIQKSKSQDLLFLRYYIRYTYESSFSRICFFLRTLRPRTRILLYTTELLNTLSTAEIASITSIIIT